MQGKAGNLLLLGLAVMLAPAVWFAGTAAVPALLREGAVTPAEAGWLVGAVQLGFVAGMMVLNFALPVYVAETIDLPGWVVGAIFTLNTALVGLGQGLVVRRMTGRVRARMMGLAQLTFVAAYALFVVAGWLPVWLAIVVMLVGAAIYTAGELTGGPVFSATAAEAAPDEGAHTR